MNFWSDNVIVYVKTKLTVMSDYELFKSDIISYKHSNNFNDWLWVCENRQWILQKKEWFFLYLTMSFWSYKKVLVEIYREFCKNQNASLIIFVVIDYLIMSL